MGGIFELVELAPLERDEAFFECISWPRSLRGDVVLRQSGNYCCDHPALAAIAAERPDNCRDSSEMSSVDQLAIGLFSVDGHETAAVNPFLNRRHAEAQSASRHSL